MRRPHLIAEQARHATGAIGRLIAFIMARETWGENRRAIEALGIRAFDHVLDVGCGHGRSLPLLASLASRGKVVGVDPSDLMIEIASERNRDLIRLCRVELAVSTAADLPFTAATFDAALCVHVVYFWKDLNTNLKAIARVMKPGGRLALIFRSNGHTKAVQSFPSDIYTFPSTKEVNTALADAGFSVQDLSDLTAPERPHLFVATRLSSALHATQSDLSQTRQAGECA